MKVSVLLLLVSIDAKLGKLRLHNSQVKEMNPGPCDYDNDGGGHGPSYAAGGIPYCCPGKYGPSCTICPGTWTVFDAVIEPWELTVCSGHGNCDGDGTLGGSGVCTCAPGFSGGGCELGPPPTTVEEACQGAWGGVKNGTCCALNQGRGETCVGYHGVATWVNAGHSAKDTCCGSMYHSDRPDVFATCQKCLHF